MRNAENPFEVRPLEVLPLEVRPLQTPSLMTLAAAVMYRCLARCMWGDCHRRSTEYELRPQGDQVVSGEVVSAARRWLAKELAASRNSGWSAFRRTAAVG